MTRLRVIGPDDDDTLTVRLGIREAHSVAIVLGEFMEYLAKKHFIIPIAVVDDVQTTLEKLKAAMQARLNL